MSTKLIQSYIYDPEDQTKGWFVSTIEREYDIPYAGGTVNGDETMVWEYDHTTKERCAMIYMGDSRWDHMEVCQNLMKNGTAATEEELRELSEKGGTE